MKYFEPCFFQKRCEREREREREWEKSSARYKISWKSAGCMTRSEREYGASPSAEEKIPDPPENPLCEKNEIPSNRAAAAVSLVAR